MSSTSLTLYNLIEKVRERPEIWQCSHPMIRNRVVHKKFWRTMSKEFGMCDQTLKKRWKHLKDQYRKELKKVMQKGLPEDIVPWKYYEALGFLKEDVIQREKERFILAGNSEEEEVSEGEPQNTDALTMLALKHAKKAPMLKKLEDSTKLNTILTQVVETRNLIESRFNQIEDINRHDADYLYLMSILPSMRQLSEIQKLHFKSKVNDWMLHIIANNTYVEPCQTAPQMVEVKTEITEEE